jgi:streptogramin lyase
LFTDFYYSAQNLRDNAITNLFIDAEKRLWITTTSYGIVLYNERDNRFVRYTHDAQQPASICANQFAQIFQDKQKFIWVGSEGYGVDYFHPDKNFLKILAPLANQESLLPSFWARAITEDKEGNLWMGWGGALTMQKENDTAFRFWKNIKDRSTQIHYNSIRSLLCDHLGDVWIGTANGVNRFRCSTHKMEFFDEKDSLPLSFYWTIVEDSRNNIWFGNRSNFYYYDASEKKIHSAAYHPILSRFKNNGVHCVFEDSKHRLWFGLNGSGLLMYDPEKKVARHWQRTETNDTTLIGNIITSLAEDKKGIIWISSFIGLVSYDPEKDKFTQYSQKNGLISLKTSCLMVDDKNRLWIGSTSGLLMLDVSRRYFKNLDMQDGLPTMEFNDQTAYKMRDGRFVFPSVKGFVVFNPNAYAENVTPSPLYLASVKVFNHELACNSNYEDLDQLKLRYNQNFFSFELAALNYVNPQQTWYAYKLEPFDKDWTYTRQRIINYTNVPGGRYIFYYKTTTDQNNWQVPVKTLSVSIGTILYKTIWFWVLVATFTTCSLYWLYRKRIEHKERIYLLQNKAQALEKEKALVQYESLKQQLNPHFLFNSLTSLSSLISANPKQADFFLENMSKIYRYILKNRDNELVPLEEEIRFVQTYIHLQKTRFENGIIINIDVKKEQFLLRIVPVTLQNLIENAIKHNVIDDENPLHIDIFSDDRYLVVRNNLQKKKFVETSNKQGLGNLQSLYHYLTRQPVHVREDEKYFIIKIPLI